MAESTLSLQYTDFQREVAFLLGWSRTPANWDNTQSTDFQDISERAQRSFYFPPSGDPEKPVYEWSFLRKTGTLTMVNADADYDLPDDFSGTVLDSSLSYASGSGNRPPKKVPEQEIRQLQAMDARNGVPRYYAIRTKAVDMVNGTRWELLTYPTPATGNGAGQVISYRYVFVPDTIGTTNVYPVCGARYSEVLLASFLAAAEFKQDDDPAGPFQQKFDTMLQAAMRADKQFKDNERGGTA